MVKLRRLRADPRQQPRPAVRPGAALRHRRPAGRGVQGPRAGAAAAEHHAGAADDGADQDLQGAARASAAASRSTWPRSSSCWSGSASWWSSSAGSRRSTSTRCSPRRSGCSRSTPAWCCTSPRSTEDQLPTPGDPALSHRSTSRPGRMKDGTDGHDPPDPPRGRAADGAVPRDALRAQRLPPLLPPDEAEPAHRARAADAHLLHRLRPRDGAGGRLHATRRRASTRSSASAG